MTTTALSLVVLAALGPVEPVASQDAPAPRIQPGTRLRVYETSATVPAVEGTASAIENGRLILNVGSKKQPLEIDLARMSRVEIRTRKSSRGKGAAIGAAAGALGLVAIVGASGGCSSEDPFVDAVYSISDTECYAGALLLGGAAGALIGLAVSHGDRWEALPVDQLRRSAESPATGSRWRVTVRPRTLGISLSLGF